MEPKFVTGFLTPRVVVRGENQESYGVCFGARRFDDGSFALLGENGVTLYDRSGHKADDFLDDVFVFKNGFVLKKSERDRIGRLKRRRELLLQRQTRLKSPAAVGWLCACRDRSGTFTRFWACVLNDRFLSAFFQTLADFAKVCTEDLKIYQGSGTGSLVLL